MRIENNRLQESYYKKVLDNGLTVLVYPMPQKTGIHALLGTHFGSAMGDFFLDGRLVQPPAGVAHFLEHKLFENEEEDAFTLFAKTGANANAYTSFDRTCYLFGATINTLESLAILLDFVARPHFTEATVAKEQGIIGEEIKMYDDNADWVLATASLRCLYHNIPLNNDIAGSVESIARITPEVLYDCYNAFYQPSNMVLSVAGNIDPEAVFALCEEFYGKLEPRRHEVAMAPVNEPRDIASPFFSQKMQIFERQFCLAYKEVPFAPEARMKGEVTERLLLELIAGETSPVYRELYDEGLLNGMFEASDLVGDDYFCLTFMGESKDPERVCARLREEIARMKEQGVDPQLFEEIKRANIGSTLCGFDNIESVATGMLTNHFKGADVFGLIDTIESVTVEDANALLATVLDPQYSALAIIEPQETEEQE